MVIKSTLFIFAFICCFINTNAQVPELWGMTRLGPQGGNIIKINGDGTGFELKYNLPPGASSDGSLFQASNGLLYAMNNSGGSQVQGQLFSYNPVTNTYQVLVEFTGTNGRYPSGNVIQHSDGKLYGMVTQGGLSNVDGLIFSYDITSGTYTDLHDFYCPGGEPYGSLTPNGQAGTLLFGMTQYGGANDKGVIFKMDLTNNNCPNVYEFSDSSGGNPYFSNLFSIGSTLYGMNNFFGPHNGGVLFSYEITQHAFTHLHDFDSATGMRPFGSLILGDNDNFYGTTGFGGTHNCGVIFKLNRQSNAYSVVYNFDSVGGTCPEGTLLKASDGKFYGMTNHGGVNNYGTIFRFDPITNNFTKLFDFDGVNHGLPSGDLIELNKNLGIDESPFHGYKVELIPNPATSHLNISIGGKPIETIRIYNTTGQLMLETKQPVNNAVDVSGLNNGVYVVEVKTKEAAFVRRLVKM